MLSFQKLDVYQRSIEFLALIYEVVEAMPRGHSTQIDQLTRAGESIIRNIAEGAGRWTRADSAHKYAIARGEAMECAGSLDVLHLRKLMGESHYSRGNELLGSIVAMLTKMMQL